MEKVGGKNEIRPNLKFAPLTSQPRDGSIPFKAFFGVDSSAGPVPK
jgi:hypothetical protein